ncbi:MAG: deoxyribonuclease V [Ferruginibacter sp.]|nr:deoxyribonuclease V [Cytophagales bacterium]
MKTIFRHEWPSSAEEAIAIQRQLTQEVITTDTLEEPVQYVAGVDVGFEQGGEVTRAAVVVLRFPELTPEEEALARQPTRFPYVPGLLSFREIPAILDALEKLTLQPGLLLCDGHGIAHPRRLGIASHLGVLTGLPTLGVGKSILVGRHEPVPQEKGSWRPLVHRGETVGAALCTRPGVAPVFISTGHRIGLETAIRYVMRCVTKYRLPETTRYAHNLASHNQSAGS